MKFGMSLAQMTPVLTWDWPQADGRFHVLSEPENRRKSDRYLTEQRELRPKCLGWNRWGASVPTISLPIHPGNSVLEEKERQRKMGGSWNTGENCVRVVRRRETTFSTTIWGSQEILPEIDRSRHSNISVLFRNMELNSQKT